MNDVSQLLHDLAEGRDERGEELFERVHAELRRLAAGTLRRSGSDPMLQTTALVNEAYLKLVGNAPVRWDGRAHFFQSAARAMRQVLIDYARQRHASKRGGERVRVELREDSLVHEYDLALLLAIDQALDGLKRVDDRCARIVDLRFFAGLSVEEVAQLLNLSPRTVKRDWEFARVWLERQLQQRPPISGLEESSGE